MIPKLAGKPHRLGVYYFRVYWFRAGLIAALSALSIVCLSLADRPKRSAKQSTIHAEKGCWKTAAPTKQEEQERTSLNSQQTDHKVVESLKRRLVRLLNKRAMDQLRQNKYASAEATTKEILALDSDNETARRLREAAINGGQVHFGSAFKKGDLEKYRQNEELNLEHSGTSNFNLIISPGDKLWECWQKNCVRRAPPKARKD